MSDEDLKQTLEFMRNFAAEHTSSPEKARAYLFEAGFITESGELAEPYRQDA
jgi:hypothetical protein